MDTNAYFFLTRSLYADGNFWYDLFLTISATANSYEEAAGEKIPSDSVRTLVETLAMMSRYSTALPGDITKRNREALGNLLLAADDPELDALARATTDYIRGLSTEFMDGLMEQVESIRERNQHE